MSKVNLPPFLDPQSDLADPALQQRMQALTAGNPNAFRLNSTIVKSESVRTIDEALSGFGWGMEFLKIHSGSVATRNDIEDVIAVCKQHQVTPYIGGGFMESAHSASDRERKVNALQRLGIETIEISDSNELLSSEEFESLVSSFRRDFTLLMVEIGSKKNDLSQPQKLARWREQLDIAMEASADRIIFEGAGNGKSGIYDSEGKAKTLLVHSLINAVPEAKQRIILEAPYSAQQMYWLRCGGLNWNTRLGNIDMASSAHDLVTDERIRASEPDIIKITDACKFRYKEVLALIKSLTSSGTTGLEKLKKRFSREKAGGIRKTEDELINHGIAHTTCVCDDDHFSDLKEDIAAVANGNYRENDGTGITFLGSSDVFFRRMP